MVMFLRSHARREDEEEEMERNSRISEPHLQLTKRVSDSLIDYFKFLPDGITLDILSRIPAELVLESKRVCTNWNNIISNHPLFCKMHSHHRLNHHSSCKLGFIALGFNYIKKTEFLCYFEYNDDEEEKSTTPIQRIKRIKFTPPFKQHVFAGSCNGLVCLFYYKSQSACVFNPITREYVHLPEIEIARGNSYLWLWTCGFGYVSSTNTYKVLVITVKGTKVEEVYIYTLGSGSGWRNLGYFGYEFDVSGWNKPAVFAHEALYWMDCKSQMIVTFDLAEEKFCEHLSPPHLPQDDISYEMGVLNGLLFFALQGDEEENRFYDVWLLKKKKHNQEKQEGAEHQSLVWRKEFRIRRMDLLAVTKTNDVFAYGGHCLIIYNTKTSTSKLLVKFKDSVLQVLPHENTLVSLKELGEEDTKVIESVEETKSHEQLQEDTDPEYVYL